MPISTLKGKNTDVKLWIPLREVESEALTQLRNVTTLPWVRSVCAMPDVHAGKGATVGSVIAMEGAVAPSAVGVDIGCGMGAVKTNLRKEDLGDLAVLRQEIESMIPVGFSAYSSPVKYAWSKRAKDVVEQLETLPKEIQEHGKRAREQLGTLGGGNHFIEVCEDGDGAIWLMLHSGSRYIGNKIADLHMKVSKHQPHNVGLVDKELSVLLEGTPEFKAYMDDLHWAQEYALANREVMFNILIEKLFADRYRRDIRTGNYILCHHNYASVEEHDGKKLVVTRKGAIRAGLDELGIIPGSMGTRSYIVRGLGNKDSLLSASHGAGRTMSRSGAKRKFTIEDVISQTQGVECRKDAGIIDEIPGAYKDIDQVMENQKDLVETGHMLKALLCVKG